MKFMMIVKHAEKQGPPPKELMDAIAILAQEEVKAGTMLGNGTMGRSVGVIEALPPMPNADNLT